MTECKKEIDNTEVEDNSVVVLAREHPVIRHSKYSISTQGPFSYFGPPFDNIAVEPHLRDSHKFMYCSRLSNVPVLILSSNCMLDARGIEPHHKRVEWIVLLQVELCNQKPKRFHLRSKDFIERATLSKCEDNIVISWQKNTNTMARIRSGYGIRIGQKPAEFQGIWGFFMFLLGTNDFSYLATSEMFTISSHSPRFHNK